jgi:hypothetical protein
MKFSLLVIACLLTISLYGNAMSVKSSRATNGFPEPPPQPTQFASKAEVKDYIRRLQEYYNVVGRPKFGRAISSSNSESGEMSLRENNYMNY